MKDEGKSDWKVRKDGSWKKLRVEGVQKVLTKKDIFGREEWNKKEENPFKNT